jgi:hypothetical protein
MRRASICLAMLAVAALGLPALATASPTVTLNVKAVPIPVPGSPGKTFPGTGNHLGAGAAVEAKFTIKGTEAIGGVPSQLTGVNFYLPKGTKLTTAGFVTCPEATLEGTGPEGCPKKSIASPVGTAGVVDPIGGTLVEENAEVQAFFAPGNQLFFYANAASPISAQLIAGRGHFTTAAPPYGPELVTTVAPIHSVPGAPDVSTTSINIKVGSAYKKGKKTVYYGTIPKTCPKGGFPVKAELSFVGQPTVTVTTKAPCPKG